MKGKIGKGGRKRAGKTQKRPEGKKKKGGGPMDDATVGKKRTLKSP